MKTALVALVLPLLLLAALSPTLSLAAVRGDSVQYVGGTLTVGERTKGKFDLTDSDAALFTFKNGNVEIPFQTIESLEYGQKAGRRVGLAVAVTPLALFSKKRKHFVTLTFTDPTGTEQGAVFEFGKKTVRNALNVLETRSGVVVEFESEQAKKKLP